MKVFIKTLGCEKNTVDSENALALLDEAGVSETDDPSKADILMVNTCGFIHDAKEQSIETIFDLVREKKEGQKLIGFAMETQDLLKNARAKLEKKNADFIVANTLTEAGAGFGVDTNHVTILSRDGEHDLGQLSKDETARRILEFCLR